ncbi:MAG: glycosyltransferase 87 family protein, partial [Actinomycetota bacterium]
MDPRRERLVGSAILGGFLLVIVFLAALRPEPPVDLAVYLRAGRAFATGQGLYGPAWGASLDHPLPYTYPPFWAAVSACVGWVPWRLASALWAVVNALLLVWIVRLSFAAYLRAREVSRSRVLPVLVIAAAITTPIALTFWFGQVGIVLTAACLADTLTKRTRLPRGVLVGLATAVKLTPGIFILFWLVTGRMKNALVAAATTAACWLLAAAVRPDLSRTFWTKVVFDYGRIGDTASTNNQSILGLLQRLGGSDRVLWLAVACVALGVGMFRARETHRVGDELAAVTLVGLTGLLVSPISWSHHAVWIVPAMGVVLGDGRSRRRILAAIAIVALYVSRLPDWSSMTSGPLEFLSGNAYVLGYLALLFLLPVSGGGQGELTAGGVD